MSYTQQLQDIRQSIISEITDIIKRKGDNPYELIDLTDEHLHWQDEFYDLPRTFLVDKYSHYDEYALISVYAEDGNIKLEGLSIDTESNTDEYTFDASETSSEVLISVLDLITELEK
jgi:hypothetical protein